MTMKTDCASAENLFQLENGHLPTPEDIAGSLFDQILQKSLPRNRELQPVLDAALDNAAGIEPSVTAILKRGQRSLKDNFINRIRANDWNAALCCVSSEHQIELCLDLIDEGLIPHKQWPKVLVDSISGGDMPCRSLMRLYLAFLGLREDGARIFDCRKARRVFQKLPETIVIYRGTIFAEWATRAIGICWTTNRDTATWFATKHGRFRRDDSPAILMSLAVDKADIVAWAFDRGESEVFLPVDNEQLASLVVTPLTAETTS